jgi:cytochrome c556
MKNVSRTLIGVFMAVLVFGAAYAQFAKPEDAINYRKAVMTLIGNHFGRMAAVVKGQKPYDKAEFEKNAQLIQTLSALPWEAFLMPGTEKVDTGLKSLPLKDQSDFTSKADAFQKEAAKLADVAGSGDLNSIKSQFGAVAQACKNCHEQYRK